LSSKLAATLEAWLHDFILDLRRRNYAERSQKGYRYELLQFVNWVAQKPDLKSAGDLTTPVLEEYQMHLMLRPSLKHRQVHPRRMTAASRNRHLAQLKSFFRYLKRTGKLLGDPSAELQGARQTKRLPKAIFSVPEMARLLEAIPKENPSGLRDWAAVEVLYSTGIRRNELLGLRVEDLHLGEEMAHILGKGGHERVVPLGKAARKALEGYLQRGRPLLLRGEHHQVFLSSYHGGAVSERELMNSLRNHARQADIRKHVTYHLFRHTCATHLLRGGADLRAIQTLLGHFQLNTTAIYTRVEISDLKNTLKRYHPREKDPPPPP